MKLRNILESILIEMEDLDKYFDLIPTTNTKSMLENLYKIAYQFSSRKMVVIHAVDYVGQHREIFEKLRKDKNINDMASFEKFVGNIQKKARLDASEQKRKDSEEYKNWKSQETLNAIEKMALDQNAEWEKRIANRDK